MILVSKANIGDYDNIASLHQELADLHTEGAPWNFVHISPSYTRDLFEEKLRDIDTFFYIAEEEDKVLGYAIFKVNHSDELPILKNRSWLFVKDIIVTKEEKGKGIGTLLMEKGEEIAQEMHLGSLELHVWSFNEEAIEFYQKKGYEPYAIKMRKEI